MVSKPLFEPQTARKTALTSFVEQFDDGHMPWAGRYRWPCSPVVLSPFVQPALRFFPIIKNSKQHIALDKRIELSFTAGVDTVTAALKQEYTLLFAAPHKKRGKAADMAYDGGHVAVQQNTGKHQQPLQQPACCSA